MCAEMEERVMRVGLGAKNDGVSTPPGTPIKLIGLLTDKIGMHPFDVNEYWPASTATSH